jgi:hypothetical protein
LSDVSSVLKRSPSGKPADSGPAGQREFLITALRAASARARLMANLADTIGVSLRNRMITCDEAVAWLREEGLLAEIEFRPGMAGGVR